MVKTKPVKKRTNILYAVENISTNDKLLLVIICKLKEVIK